MKEIPLGDGQNAKVDDEDFAIYYFLSIIYYCNSLFDISRSASLRASFVALRINMSKIFAHHSFLRLMAHDTPSGRLGVYARCHYGH